MTQPHVYDLVIKNGRLIIYMSDWLTDEILKVTADNVDMRKATRGELKSVGIVR